MAVIIEMPKLSDTMEEGAIGSWLKKEGDAVEEGEALVEIETDKATMEYESPEDGYLLKVIVANGGKCPLNAPIAVVGDKGETFDLAALMAANGGSPAPSPAETTPAASAPAPTPASPATVAPPAAASQQLNTRVKASPLAKKLAKEKGIDLATVHGSGPAGRVIMQDIASATPGLGALSNPPAGPVGQDVLVPVNMMRATIAKRLLAAKNDAPHFYLKRSINMTNVNKWRQTLNDEVAAWKDENPPPRVSVNDIIMLACAKALKKHPFVNASWEGENIRQWGQVHVAMAVALPSGLITPIVRNTDLCGVRQIAVQTKALAKKAKGGQLGPEDYTGGTFTVSNLGMMGIEDFTAIINPPQSCILAVGATNKVPWVNEQDELEVQPRMTVTLSCDHRVVDGAVGASFLQTLTQYLEVPMMMFS